MVDAFKGVPYSFSALRKTFGRSRAPPSAGPVVDQTGGEAARAAKLDLRR